MISLRDVTREFLIKSDNEGKAWMTWSWLSMIGMESCKDKYEVYKKIYETKELMEKEGYSFKVDRVKGV